MNGIYHIAGVIAFWGSVLLAAFVTAMVTWLKLYNARQRRIAREQREHHAGAPWLDPARYGVPDPGRPPVMPRTLSRAVVSRMHDDVERYLTEAADGDGAR